MGTLSVAVSSPLVLTFIGGVSVKADSDITSGLEGLMCLPSLLCETPQQKRCAQPPFLS
jgi:hypothetical protein